MRKSQTTQISTRVDWQMPLSLEQYDRNPVLTGAERDALAEVVALPPLSPLSGLIHEVLSAEALTRLMRPLQDVYDFKQCYPRARVSYLRRMCQQMYQRNKSFWGWSKEEWLSMISDTNGNRGIAITMRVTAYLLCGLLVIEDRYLPAHLARLIFGTTQVAKEYEKVAIVIYGSNGFGYMRHKTQEIQLQATLVLAMLIHRNPHIEAFTLEGLRATKQLLTYEGYRQVLRWMVRALVYLKIVEEAAFADLFGSSEESPVWWEYTKPDVDSIWVAWVQAYVTQTVRGVESYQKDEFHQLLIAGRWLKKYHPEKVSPAQWDEPLAYEYVTWICQAKKYELVSACPLIPRDASQDQGPLQAQTMNGRIGTVRRFFLALQRRPYQVRGYTSQRLVLTFDPHEVLAAPENIKRQLVPNPRTLDPAWWQKLTWAAATVSAQDLSAYGGVMYPLAYYRAAALVWVTGARRSDEIRRLKVGSVSWEWAPEMDDEDGNQVEPGEDFAYLRIPVNKMRGEYWIPIPAYTADAIEMWEQLRPKLQEPQMDRKEHKPTDYLFMTRNQLMGQGFLNGSVIPLLCKVAGLVDEDDVPLRDAVGKITSHRARSTLATWLRSNGLSLTYIAKLLGHTDLKSLPWYLREDKHQFARAVRKHNPLNRIVTAIMDTEALKRGTGEPVVFYYLGYGEDGRPHLCASPDYSRCVHQMQCRKCEMYVDAEQAEVIERREGALIIEVHIPTPKLLEEQLNQDGLGAEITQCLPAPEVPGPAYHLNKNVPPRSSDLELEQLKKDLEMFSAEWTEKAEKFDLRSVAMKSLKKRIADLAAKIEEREKARGG